MRRLTTFRSLLGAAALALAVGGCATEGDAGDPSTAALAAGDGVTRADAARHARGHHARWRGRHGHDGHGPGAWRHRVSADELAKYDTNKDGKLDDTERAAMRKAHFAEKLAKYDTNKDGKLDDTERAAMKKARIAALMTEIDTDGDGKISKQEASAAPRMAGRALRDFERADTDGDGFVTEAELTAAMPSRFGHHHFGRRHRNHR